MEQVPSVLGPNSGKIAIRTGLSVVALLILRGIIGSLPMLKNGAAIGESFLGDSLLSPLVIANAILDSIILLVIMDFGLRLGRGIKAGGKRYSELGTIVVQCTLVLVLILAYKMYELPAACFFVGRADLVNLSTTTTSTPGSYGDFMRVWGQMVNQISTTAIQNATGDALTAYQQLALAVFRRPPNYYAWTFLVLIALPVIGLVPLVHRNLDTIAELLFHSAASLQGTSGSPAPVTTSQYAPVMPQQAVGQQAVGPRITLRELVEKISKLRALSDSGAISGADFETQKLRILAQPEDGSNAALDPDDFLKLKELRESGAITTEEFETQKQRFLRQI